MWTPSLEGDAASLAGRLVEALERDVRSGRLERGARLPTQRDLARRLGVAVGTVTAAYGRAAKRGLIESRVGSGSFVADGGPARREEPILMLSHNLPPLGPSERRFKAALAKLQRHPKLLEALTYAPPEGLLAHRRAGADWLERRHRLGGVDVDRLIVTTGAQQAIFLALQTLTAPGETILAEAATFVGFKGLAHQLNRPLRGLLMDAEGLRPELLEEEASKGARVLYTIPTLQNPTGRIMSERRRRAVAAIARKHDLWIIEDDVYGAFASDAPPPLAHYAPDRTIYLTSLSKTVAPGLRTGFLTTPSAEIFGRVRQLIRAESYAPPTLAAFVTAHWIDEGEADAISDEIGAEIAGRTAAAQRLLSPHLPPLVESRCPHLWLPMSELAGERLVAHALRAGVELTPVEAPLLVAGPNAGVRLCVGAPVTQAVVEKALSRVGLILNSPAAGPDSGLV